MALSKNKSWALAAFCIQIAISTGLFALLAWNSMLPSTPLHLSLEIQLHLVSLPWISDLLIILMILNIGTGYLLHLNLGTYRRGTRLILLPFLFLPLAFLGFFWIELLPPPIESNLLFWLPIVCLSLSTFHLFNLLTSRTSRKTYWLYLFILVTLPTIWYTTSGVTTARRFGEHGVDEGHYIIQIESLYKDHDLNIKNNIEFEVEKEIRRQMAADRRGISDREKLREIVVDEIRAGLHVRPDSPPDRWYSWHPWGISALLTPVMPLGMSARYLSLALISAAGFVMIFLLSTSLKVKSDSAFLLTLLVALSSYWTVYSIRVLPEVLGGTLFVAAIASAYIYRRIRWAGLLLFVATCLFMPVAHPRFAPCVLIAAAFFLHQLIAPRITRRSIRVGLLLTMIGGCFAAIALTAFFPEFISRITSYSLESNFFMLYPEGIWLVLFSERGIFFSFPLAIVLVISGVYAAVNDKENTCLHITALSAFILYTVLWGSVDCWDGGPTLPGRYLLICMPLMIPAAAFTYERASPLGKMWIVFMGVYSIFPFILNFLSIEIMPRDFMRMLISCIKWIIPHFRNLLIPYHFTDINIGKPYDGIVALLVTPFSLSLFVISAIIVLNRRRYIQYLALTTLAVIYTLVSLDNIVHDQPYPQWIAQKLSQMPVADARIVNGVGPVPNLMEISNLFDRFTPRTITRDAAAESDASIPLSGQRFNNIDPNDYAWITLAEEFHPGRPGPKLMWIRHKTEGRIKACITLIEGSKPLVVEELSPSPVDTFYKKELETAGADPVQILIGIEKTAEGAIHVSALGWTPLPRDAEY